ncbi:MAG TPA: alanine racemase [Terracidiphilus sp.]|jgi:alanine racemase|nr:alanine racemase [Terracidiphilus sp.]
MRPCRAEISSAALEENYRTLRSLAPPETECLAIVKADAYGHSLALCAPASIRAGAQWLGVTSVEEGVAARALCPNAQILVIGGIFPGQGSAVLAHRLTAVVWDATQFDELALAAGAANAAPASIPVHLEVDTGMSRQGVSLDDLAATLARFDSGSPFALQAVMTHLYASDDTTGHTTAAQLARLDEALSRMRALLPAIAPKPQWLSVGATAALLSVSADQLAALGTRWNLRLMLRLGLALYGVVPRFAPPFAGSSEPAPLAAATARLKPVLAWKTSVVSVRTVPAGAEVGYNGTFIATEPMRLALIAAGYADGLDRRLGNRFSLLVRGQRAPIVGRISMDQAVLDVTEIPGVAPGDEVILIGSQQGETISVFDHADAAGTIPWEVFTRIAARVPRVQAESL